MSRVVLLNALPVNAFMLSVGERVELSVRRISLEEARTLITAGRVANYIRHPATVQVLNRLFGVNLTPSSELYTYRPGDILLIVVVTQRSLQRGQEVQVAVEDLEFYLVTLF